MLITGLSVKNLPLCMAQGFALLPQPKSLKNKGVCMDIVEQMRSFEFDHEPDGWPAIQMKQVSALCDEIERLRAVIDAANAQEPLAKSYKNSSTGTGVEFLVINEMPEGETELYAHPIPAQQSPAVAVPDDWNAQCTCGHRWHAVMPTENCPSCNPSPRIT